MTTGLEERLRQRHPSLLQHLHGDPMKSPLAHGLEIEDGWYDIIDRLLTNIEAVIAERQIQDFEIRQVKQKFGSLRVYVSDPLNPHVAEVVNAASAEAKSTCERCGGCEQTTLRNVAGNLRTLCPSCFEGKPCS